MFLVPEGDDPRNVEVRRLVIRPGDRLVLQVDHPLSLEEADGIHAAVCRSFEGADYVPPVLILEPGMEIGVIGPDGSAAPAQVSVELGGSGLDDEFFRWLRDEIRRRGGDPKAFG